MLSKLKKKLKPRLPGSKHKPDKTGTGADGERVDPTGSLSRPGPQVVAGGGRSDVEVAVGSGSRREGDDSGGEEVERVYPSPSTPSLVRGRQTDGIEMRLFLLLLLIVPSDNVDISTAPDHGPEVARPNEGAEPSAAADEKGLGWKSAASSTAKLLLRGVRDSADAFGPLKSVASGLCFVLDNCEVCPPSNMFSVTLTGAAANEGKSASDRIVGTPGQNAR
jgi:hypothetical protein